MTSYWPLIDPSRPQIHSDSSACTLLFTNVVFAKYLCLDFFGDKNELNLEKERVQSFNIKRSRIVDLARDRNHFYLYKAW